MGPEDFAQAIRTEIVESNLDVYRRYLNDDIGWTDDSQPWPGMIALYRSMSAADRSVVEATIRQVIVDTLSTMLGVLDGTTGMTGPDEGFTLTYADDPEPLNGDLQDYFLAAEEDGD